MNTSTSSPLAQLRGLARLGIDATQGVVGVVEQMHRTISDRAWPLSASRAPRTTGLTGAVYGAIRGTTGVVGIIKNGTSDRAIGLRADMDALPIIEANEVPYKSKREGVMHACGHDVHTSSLLGTAKILQEIRGEFEGTIKLLFQPAEEKAPGGASIMIQDGALQNPVPTEALSDPIALQMMQGSRG